MFKKFVIVIVCGAILSGCSLIPRRSGIEIMAYPTSKVYIDGKEAGMTPYKNSSLNPKETEIRLVANNLSWSKNIKLQNNVNTVIDWEFGKDDNTSGGYVLYMEKTGDQKKAGLIVNASPDKSAIAVEGEIKGFSPTKIENINEGDRQVTISFPAHKTINVFVKAIRGYQLVIDTKLAEEETMPTEEIKTEEISNSPISTNKKRVTILPTETGWLRVRGSPHSGGVEVAKIKPKEKYDLLEEAGGWYKIDLGNGKTGWISAKYAAKVE